MRFMRTTWIALVLTGCGPLAGLVDDRPTKSTEADASARSVNASGPISEYQLWGLPYHAAVQYGNAGRGGAALRVPAYVHVATLDAMIAGVSVEGVPPAPRPAMGPAIRHDPITSSPELTKAAHASPRPGTLWARFCDPNQILTEREHEQVARLGGWDAVPEDLRQNCLPPK